MDRRLMVVLRRARAQRRKWSVRGGGAVVLAVRGPAARAGGRAGAAGGLAEGPWGVAGFDRLGGAAERDVGRGGEALAGSYRGGSEAGFAQRAKSPLSSTPCP